ncbi:MAG: acyl carrier protein [Crocosphaera sp.]|uniref:Acyl carrier protein n=3 Tax=Crocosphaera watsonii TaxID=263511 RepID=T2JHR3_CROWT|nr:MULTISPECIES: acyl carrier protein [Crocosphaera]EHJ09314.1 Acyl carrier protein [Crocosphaera watsonii WH 0003]MCH2248150.1 acyl carrier protein [Crocosphaera sp.]CCQ54058.1 Acyl carrier protein [Crocosphaera watsonii WH 0005]CCQ64805.1 Acyl carrier protein [Crocosphaera watsonii WH 0402]
MTSQNSEKPPDKSQIQAWLSSQLAQTLEIDANQIDITLPFESYGLDSESAVVLSGELQDWLKCDLEPTLLFDYPTIEAVADYIVKDEVK